MRTKRDHSLIFIAYKSVEIANDKTTTELENKNTSQHKNNKKNNTYERLKSQNMARQFLADKALDVCMPTFLLQLEK